MTEAGCMVERQGNQEVSASVSEPPALAQSETFEDVFRSSYAQMMRVAFAITGSNDAAEDIVQDAFVALLSRFDSVADPPAYLYRSVVNGCRARFRRKSVVDRMIRLRVVSEVRPPEIDETRMALDRLSTRARAAVVLRYYADLSTDDIAAALGCQPGTVRSILHRALANLNQVVVR
jgi:RNA polymerase sigma factor (sigma-70 family)